MQGNERDNVHDWLHYHSQYNASDLAVVDLETARHWTYAQFNERATRLATGLHQVYGVAKGDRVAILAHNSSDIFECLFACWKLGAIFTPLNWRLAPPEIAHLVAHAAPKLIFYDREFESLVRDVDGVKIMREPMSGGGAYEQLIASHEPDVLMNGVGMDDVHAILYTSGTTGRPKGVMYTHRMTFYTVVQSALHADLNRTSRTLTFSPLFHTAGLNAAALSLFHHGGTLYIMKRWDAAKALAYFSDPELGITHVNGVPTTYIMMSELPEFETASFPTIKFFGVGSAPISMDLLETWKRKGADLAQSYGMTEVFGVSLTPPHRAAQMIGSAGHPMMHVDVRIADESGMELPRGEVGEIQVRGPGVTPGYWREPELTKAAFIDGWLKTGDLARMDDSGALFIVDRLKDMYISGGENVYPSEIENVISAFEEVSQVAVIEVPHPKWGEVGLALILLRAGQRLDQDTVLARCRENLAAYKVPKHISFVKALPLNAQGKVLKKDLRREYAAFTGTTKNQ